MFMDDLYIQSQFSLTLRFGMALSKVRTHLLRMHRRDAKRFLRDAKNITMEFDKRTKVNRAWVAGCDRQPVMDFLSAR